MAGTMQRLGIFMGDELPNNYEDPRFGPGQAPARMRAAIAERNEAHDIWGWKFPAASNLPRGAVGTTCAIPTSWWSFVTMAATMKAHMRWHNREITLAAHEILMQQQKELVSRGTLAGADPC